MKTAIAIFCKTPDLSPVKTRLGLEIGKNYAEEFYRLSIAVMKEVVHEVTRQQTAKVDAYWAVAEKEAVTDPLWNSFACIWTGEGGLGERIHQVYEQLLPTYDQVIIIGSDSPQISADYILNAIMKLSKKDVDIVIGPCVDGGFVLFGSKKMLPKSIWTEVKYSREDTLEQLVSLLNRRELRLAKVSELGDVDTYNDLITLMNDYIKSGSRLLPGQRRLFSWLHDILITRKVYQKTQLSRVPDRIL